MISPKFFYDTLAGCGIDFFTGVPDSLLKNLCAFITEHSDGSHHIIPANEGGAVGIAAGHYLATGRIAAVYLQNSGEGNIINPLASLTDPDVYGIPVLLIIGWRGEPGVPDEPQHLKQGKVTCELLKVMGVEYSVLSKDEPAALLQIQNAVERMRAGNQCYALVVEKDTFASCPGDSIPEKHQYPMSREEAIQAVAAATDTKDIIVSTTGMISRELFEYRVAAGRSHQQDFLTVGSMGHASQIALGVALEKKDRRVWCFDGDGAAIMHMGGMAVVGTRAPENYVHVLFNNGAHDSVGGQPTAGLAIDFPAIAAACGYRKVLSVSEKAALTAALEDIGTDAAGPVFLEIKVRKGCRKDLGRPTTKPVQNKEALMDFLKG